MTARTKAQVLEGLTAGGIVPVIRADSADTAVKVVEALVAGGIRTLEITMTVPDAIGAIRMVAEKFGQRRPAGRRDRHQPRVGRGGDRRRRGVPRHAVCACPR